MEFWAQELPLPWPLVSLVVLALVALAWLLGRGDRRDVDTQIADNDRRISRLEGWLEGRAAERLHTGATVAAAGSPLAWPELAVPETVDTAGDPTAVLPQVAADATLTAADHPPLDGHRSPSVQRARDVVETARRDADAALDQAGLLPEPAGLELDDDPALDDDGGEGDDDGGGPGPTPEPATTYAAAMPLPRYDWGARWDPLAGPGLPPPGRPQAMPGPWGRAWDMLSRQAARAWRAYLTRARERAEDAARRRADRRGETGWAPGEMTGEQPATGRVELVQPQPDPQQPEPEPAVARVLAQPTVALRVIGRARARLVPLHQPRHVWGQRMVSAAALITNACPVRPPGQHRCGTVPGAVGQRQSRLRALPAGAR